MKWLKCPKVVIKSNVVIKSKVVIGVQLFNFLSAQKRYTKKFFKFLRIEKSRRFARYSILLQER